jgi:hypothetical protein
VGQASTGCYIQAELRSRGEELSKPERLNHPNLSAYKIYEAIERHQREKESGDRSFYLKDHSKPGINGDNIYDLIHKGVQSAKAAKGGGPDAGPSAGASPGNGPSWMAAAGQKSITPGGVQRPGTSSPGL